MDLGPLRSRPPGVVAIVLLTLWYGVYVVGSRLVGASRGTPAFVAAVAAFVVAYGLWQGRFSGWVAAVVLYALLTVDTMFGAMVFGLTENPLVIVTAVAFVYLLVARRRVYSASLPTESAS